LKARFAARQIVGLEVVEHVPVFESCFDAGIDLCCLQLEFFLVRRHRLDDLVAQSFELLVLGIDPGLQPVAHVALAVVAGFDRE